MSRRPTLRVLPGGLEPVGRCTPMAAPRPGGVVAHALAAAGAWLVEPADAAVEPAVSAPTPPRPVIAVFGLARGCGVTTVARGLAAELAGRDAEGAAAVHGEARAAGLPLATQAASRLARTLAEVPGATARAIGRLCLVGGAEQASLADTARHHAPLVLDAGSAGLGGVPAALADRVVLVAVPSVEPALAEVAAECLGRLGHSPLVVLNRARPEPPEGPAADEAEREQPAGVWHSRPSLQLPDSRMGAQLALGGREPRGELGRAVARLADLCELGS